MNGVGGCPANCGLTGGCPQCNYRILPIIDLPNVPVPGLAVPAMPQQGWECPKCKRIYGPNAMECWHCNNLINMFSVGGPSK